MYSTFNKVSPLLLRGLLELQKNKIFKHMTTISKNVYIDVLNDIVNRYNNTVYRTIKMKPIDGMGNSYVEYNEDSKKKKILNLKLMTMEESLSTKLFLLKAMFLIVQNKFLLLMRLKIKFLGLLLLLI